MYRTTNCPTPISPCEILCQLGGREAPLTNQMGAMSGLALPLFLTEHIPSHSKYATDDNGQDAVRMLLCVDQRQSGTPTAAEHHPLVNRQMTPQSLQISHQMPRCVLLQCSRITVSATTASILLITVSWSWSACTQHHVKTLILAYLNYLHLFKVYFSICLKVRSNCQCNKSRCSADSDYHKSSNWSITQIQLLLMLPRKHHLL